MANELSRPLYNRTLAIPNEFNWENLTNKKGAELEAHYSNLPVER